MVQFGTYSGTTTAGGALTVTLPTAFKDTNHVGVSSIQNEGKVADIQESSAPTSQSFSVIFYSATTTVLASTAVVFNYIRWGEKP